MRRVFASPVFGVLGSSLLLLSFLLQNILLARYVLQAQRYESVLQHYSRSYLSSIEHVNGYFIQALATGKADQKYLTKAALENWAGFGTFVIENDPALAEQVVRLGELAGQVHDIDSYNAYIGEVNRMEASAYKNSDRRFQSLNAGISQSTMWFAALYVVGSILLVGHQFLKDNRATAAQPGAAADAAKRRG
jgi:hypothetical protein